MYFIKEYIFTKNNNNLKNLGRPPAFACHREKSSKQAKEITYDDCKVITDGMNPRTGIFTVKVFFVDPCIGFIF